MAFQVHSAKLPTGDTPICGVTLDPYVLVKRVEGSVVSGDDVPQEGSDGVYQLRSRWYRSTTPKGGSLNCNVHPDREAGAQCLICLRSKVPVHLSYHCSAECMKSNWHLHKDYHKQYMTNGGEFLRLSLSFSRCRTGPAR